MRAQGTVTARVENGRSLLARGLVMVLLTAGIVTFGSSPARANQPTPPFPTGVNSLSAEAVPTDCPRTADRRWIGTRDTDIYQLCRDALRMATTYEAERAILYAFAKLGTPYSQNSTLRTTTHFDCSSFVGRAFTAARASVRKANGTWVNFFPYFGWTGAYVPVAYWSNGVRYGYEGTNVIRVWNRKDLKPGDIIIQFNGTNPANSAGNEGHAQLYLGGEKVIQSGGSISNVNVAYEGNYLSNEWYFRYNGNYKDSTQMVLPGGSVTKIKAGEPGQSVLGNLIAVSPVGRGFTTLYPCLEGRPLASVNNFVPGRTVANFAATRTDAEGNICIYQSTGAHIVWDQVWTGTAITAQTAQRILDTRQSGLPVPANGVQVVQTGAPGATVMANLTVVGPEHDGYTTVYPCAEEMPFASNSNYTTGIDVPNFVSIGADENGEVCVFTTAPAHLLWDQMVVTDAVEAHAPNRLFDSREVPNDKVRGNWGHRLEPGRSFVVAQVEPFQTVMGNLTVAEPLNPGHTQIYPCESAPPSTSVNNFTRGLIAANFTTVRADSQGLVCASASEWTHVVWDQMSETFTVDAATQRRLFDSRVPGVL